VTKAIISHHARVCLFCGGRPVQMLVIKDGWRCGKCATKETDTAQRGT